MKRSKCLLLICALLATGLVISCGGGGGGTAEAPTPADPLAPAGTVALDATQFDFSGGAGDSGDGGSGAGGAAGDGAPIRKAVIVITDADGKTASGLTDDKGNYFVKFTGFKAPIVAKVIDAGGNVLTSVTDETPATGKAVRLMINPLTDKIVSDSVVSGAVPGTDKSFDGSKVDLAKLTQAKKDLRTSINAALAVAGVTSTAFDPIKSVYAYDGKGVDAVIESISHTREPNTGATQLRAKLANVDTVVPITAAAPLAVSNVALPTSPALTYAKLQAWIDQINSCLAIAPGTVTPCDNNAKQLRSTNYLNNSRDFEEDFRKIFSEGTSRASSERVPNVTFRNPVVLFVGKYAGSTASYDDLAVVEVTIKQPRIGLLGPSGGTTDPVEYVQYLVFKRDDSLAGAAGSNWILHGNQRDYDISVSPRYERRTQVNSLVAANTSGNQPSHFFSSLRINIAVNKFDAAAQTYVPSNFRAVRVTGPGLPTAGVVMANSTTTGTGGLSAHNQTGTVASSGAMTTSNTTNSIRLNALATDGSALYSGFWPTTNATYASPAVTDFSVFPAFALYKFEIFLTSNLGNTTPDDIEYGRILAPIAPPSVGLAMPFNDMSPSFAGVTPTQASDNKATVYWNINLNAAPVETACVYQEERSPKGAVSPTSYTVSKFSFCRSVASAYSQNSRPTSFVVTTGPAMLPQHTTSAGDYRELQTQAWQGRSNYTHLAIWRN